MHQVNCVFNPGPPGRKKIYLSMNEDYAMLSVVSPIKALNMEYPFLYNDELEGVHTMNLTGTTYSYKQTNPIYPLVKFIKRLFR